PPRHWPADRRSPRTPLVGRRPGRRRHHRPPRALERIHGRPWRLAVPKSESGKRFVPLIGPTAEALRAQRTLALEMRLAVGAAWQDLDFVFPTAIGTPGDQSNVYHQFKKLLRQAGLPDCY